MTANVPSEKKIEVVVRGELDVGIPSQVSQGCVFDVLFMYTYMSKLKDDTQ